MTIWIKVGKICKVCLAVPQNYSLGQENPFFYPWICLHFLVGAKLFLLSVWWPLMLEE